MLAGTILFTLMAIFLICVNENISSDFSEDIFAIKFLSFLIGIIFIVDIYLFIEFLDPSITPMDVYKGKTTIQYTIVDGIKTDSCVVWKSDIKK